MSHEFWATEYHEATKTADVAGRVIGHGLLAGPDIVGGIAAHQGYNRTLDEADLTPEERAYADQHSGFGSGLRAGAYSGLGALAGGLGGTLIGTGLGAGVGALTGNAQRGATIGGQLGMGAGALGGSAIGANMAGRTTANHRLQELDQLDQARV